MATLTLTKLWINVFATGESVSAFTMPDRDFGIGVEGGVRTYAGGRRRGYTVPGDIGSFTFTLLELTADQVTTLFSWRGIVVQVRDHRGQRFVGHYREVKQKEVQFPYLYHATITLETLSFVDGV